MTDVVRLLGHLTSALLVASTTSVGAARTDVVKTVGGAADRQTCRRTTIPATVRGGAWRHNCLNLPALGGSVPSRYSGISIQHNAVFHATLATSILFSSAKGLLTTEMLVNAFFRALKAFVDEVVLWILPHTQPAGFQAWSNNGLQGGHKNRPDMTAFAAQFAVKNQQ